MTYPCKFFQQGRCSAGYKCKFDHDPSVLNKAVQKAPCRFFARGEGYCAAGDACQYAHVKKERQSTATGAAPRIEQARARPLPVGYAVPSKHAAKEGPWTSHEISLASGEEDLTYSMETLSVGHEEGHSGATSSSGARMQVSYAAHAQKNIPNPDGGAQRSSFPKISAHDAVRGFKTDEDLAYRASVMEQIALCADKECGVCLDKVQSKGEQFGLLDGCNHVFCLSCIREWRAITDLGKEVKRSCPLCREVSGWVIPSSFVPSTNESKNLVAAKYRDRLSQIQCRHFQQGNGECPFGTSCFYRHEYRDGTVQRYEPPRLRLNDEGELQAVAALKLCDLIMPSY